MAKRKQPKPPIAQQPMASIAEGDAATYLGYTTATLRAWRRLSKGPPFIRAGRSIRYVVPDLAAWQSRHRVEPERHHFGRDEHPPNEAA